MGARLSAAKKQPKPSMKNIVEVRRARGENQGTFWTRFGVTQSGGSRYENGRDIPAPTATLVMLFLTGAINDTTLAKGRKLASS